VFVVVGHLPCRWLPATTSFARFRPSAKHDLRSRPFSCPER
jgi:hypothetical protein